MPVLNDQICEICGRPVLGLGPDFEKLLIAERGFEFHLKCLLKSQWFDKWLPFCIEQVQWSGDNYHQTIENGVIFATMTHGYGHKSYIVIDEESRLVQMATEKELTHSLDGQFTRGIGIYIEKNIFEELSSLKNKKFSASEFLQHLVNFDVEDCYDFDTKDVMYFSKHNLSNKKNGIYQATLRYNLNYSLLHQIYRKNYK